MKEFKESLMQAITEAKTAKKAVFLPEEMVLLFLQEAGESGKMADVCLNATAHLPTADEMQLSDDCKRIHIQNISSWKGFFKELAELPDGSAATAVAKYVLKSKRYQKYLQEEKIPLVPTDDEIPEFCSLIRQPSNLVGRTKELRVLQTRMEKLKHKGVLLVGEPGVGKSEIVYKFATMTDRPVIEVSFTALQAGTSMHGALEEKLSVLHEFMEEHKNYIMFLDELQSVKGETSLLTWLKKEISSGAAIIAAVTPEDAKALEKDQALLSRFERLKVEEPTEVEMQKILHELKPIYESGYAVKYTCKDILGFARKLPGCNPRKSIQLMETAGAIAVFDKKKTVTKAEFAEAVESQLGYVPDVTPEEAKVVSFSTLEKELNEIVIGQEEAVSAVVKPLKRSAAGFKEANKPLANLFFFGSTGTGKTFLAEKAAEKTGRKFLKIDCSELSEEVAVTKLVGSSAGYVGYEEGGRLVNFVRQNPNGVILFDEIEKAHASIYNLLLQVMDSARLTDGKGNTADFADCLVIFTSNVGLRAAAETKKSVGFISESAEEKQAAVIDSEFSKMFSPEFRNRISKKILFNPIGKEQATKIATTLLQQFAESNGVKGSRRSLDWTDEVISLMIERGVSPEFGARELKRQLAEIQDKLVDVVIDNPKAKKLQVIVDNDEYAVILK